MRLKVNQEVMIRPKKEFLSNIQHPEPINIQLNMDLMLNNSNQFQLLQQALRAHKVLRLNNKQKDGQRKYQRKLMSLLHNQLQVLL